MIKLDLLFYKHTFAKTKVFSQTKNIYSKELWGLSGMVRD